MLNRGTGADAEAAAAGGASVPFVIASAWTSVRMSSYLALLRRHMSASYPGIGCGLIARVSLVSAKITMSP